MKTFCNIIACLTRPHHSVNCSVLPHYLLYISCMYYNYFPFRHLYTLYYTQHTYSRPYAIGPLEISSYITTLHVNSAQFIPSVLDFLWDFLQIPYCVLGKVECLSMMEVIDINQLSPGQASWTYTCHKEASFK